MRFAEHGAYVTLADVQDEAGQRYASELSGKGYHVTFVHCDTSSWESSVAAFKHAVNFSPRKTLDAAALFAGIGGDSDNMVSAISNAEQPSLDNDPAEPSLKIIDINLDGVIKSAHLALHYFRMPAVSQAEAPKSTTKNLMLCTSLSGYVDYGATQYCISKFGVRGLFRSLRSTAGKDTSFPLTVNLIAPGYTRTPIVTAGPDDLGQRAQMVQRVSEQGLWASVDYVVQFASICATNDEVNGRSYATIPSGLFDLDEDMYKGYGGQRLLELLKQSGYERLGFS